MLNACLLLLIMGSLMMMFTFMWWWCQWSGIWRYEIHNRVLCRNLLSGVNIWGGGTSLRRDSNKNLFRKSSRGVDGRKFNFFCDAPNKKLPNPDTAQNGGITQKYNIKHLHNYTCFNSVKKHQDSHQEWTKCLNVNCCQGWQVARLACTGRSSFRDAPVSTSSSSPSFLYH